MNEDSENEVVGTFFLLFALNLDETFVIHKE